jgi:hypothetical protein
MSRRTDFVSLITHPTPRAAPRAACDHGVPAGWQVESTHRTSEGTVAYARCPCGALLVLLNGQPQAVGHPRPRAATPPVPGERPLGRGRLGLWLWDRGGALWRGKGKEGSRCSSPRRPEALEKRGTRGPDLTSGPALAG